MQITRGKIQRAQRVALYGPEGIGKSTFAAQFPNPLFIDTEGSTSHLDVARTEPAPSSWAMLLSQVAYVKAHPDVCGTLVIDTADWAEKLCIDAICAKSQKDGIEDFGYGKGYVYLVEEFGRLLNALNDLIDLGIHVVFTAHAQLRKFEQPDEAGSYDRWELKLEKKTAPLLKEWADMVLFANYKTYVVNVDGQGAEKGKNKARGGKRVMYTAHHPAWDAKNRHDLPDELDLSFDAIAHCFAVAPSSTPPTKVAPAAKPEATAAARSEITYWHNPSLPCVYTAQTGENVTHHPNSVQIDRETYERLKTEYENAAPSTPDPEPITPKDELEAAGVPKALADLMRPEGVSVDEIQAVVASKGYYPADTPLSNYDDGFVQGVLIGAWSAVLDAIKVERELQTVPF